LLGVDKVMGRPGAAVGVGELLELVAVVDQEVVEVVEIALVVVHEEAYCMQAYE
jgi:hypothetical protein